MTPFYIVHSSLCVTVQLTGFTVTFISHISDIRCMSHCSVCPIAMARISRVLYRLPLKGASISRDAPDENRLF